MGCWNETCALSGLPILGGDAVRAYIVVQKRFDPDKLARGASYIDEYFDHLFLPVRGTYDEYGSVDTIVCDWNAQYILDTTQRWQNQGVWIDRAHQTRFAVSCVSDVIHRISEGVIQYSPTGVRDRAQSVGLILILEDVCAAMLTAYRATPSMEVQERQRMIVQSVQTIRDNVKAKLSPVMILGAIPGGKRSLLHYANEWLTWDKIDEFTTQWEDLLVVDGIFGMLRRQWMPTPGKGSQVEEYELHEALAGAVLNHAQIRMEIEMEDEGSAEPIYTCADCARFDGDRGICGGPGPTYAVITVGKNGRRETYLAEHCKQFVLGQTRQDVDNGPSGQE